MAVDVSRESKDMLIAMVEILVNLSGFKAMVLQQDHNMEKLTREHVSLLATLQVKKIMELVRTELQSEMKIRVESILESRVSPSSAKLRV